jgi:hypothetical protein
MFKLWNIDLFKCLLVFVFMLKLILTRIFYLLKLKSMIELMQYMEQHFICQLLNQFCENFNVFLIFKGDNKNILFTAIDLFTFSKKSFIRRNLIYLFLQII